MAAGTPSNEEVADVLDQIGDLLEAQKANRFRVRAYRNAAHTVRMTDETIAGLTRDGGEEALKQLPDIGEGIARVISRGTSGPAARRSSSG